MSVPLVAGFLGSTHSAEGQEALRNAVQGDRNYQTRRQQPVQAPMKLHAGPVGFNVGANLGVTYDDNTLLSGVDPQEDVIISPGAVVGVYWPITDRTRLNFGVGIAYDIYTQGSREDRLNLSPNSEVAFDFEIGRSLITVYDRFTFTQDLIDQGEAINTGDFGGGFDNSAGVRVSWVPEPVLVEGGYSWNIFISSDEANAELDRTSHQVFGRIGQIIAEKTRWGVEATGSSTLYDTGERNDFNNVSVGPYLEWQATEWIRVNLRGGWTWTFFEESGTQPAPDDLSVPYMALDARHQLTAHFNHNLSVVREVRVGFNSDYVESLTARYGFGWELSSLITLNAGAFYELGTEPGLLGDEDYERIGFDVGLPFRLTNHLGFSLGYQFTIRDSNQPDRDYHNNRATASFSYQF